LPSANPTGRGIMKLDSMRPIAAPEQ
jgi:hypothetical protein